MIEVAVTWLIVSLLVLIAVYDWKGNRNEAAFAFWAWPFYVLLIVAAAIVMLIALAYFSISNRE